MDLKEKESTKTTLQSVVEEDAKKKRVIKTWVKVVSAIGITIAIALFALLVYPVVLSFTQSAEEELFLNIERMGVFGYIALYIMQVLQVVIAVIPGGVVQFMAGYMADMTWLGILICLVGVYTGQVIIFRLVRRFGHNLVEAVADGEKLKRWNFIRNEKKLELIAFILFVIPGMPKDLFCYMFPLTTIREDRFMVISVIGRIPAVVSSIYAADYLRSGKYITAGVIWGIITLISLGAIITANAILSRRKNKEK